MDSRPSPVSEGQAKKVSPAPGVEPICASPSSANAIDVHRFASPDRVPGLCELARPLSDAAERVIIASALAGLESREGASTCFSKRLPRVVAQG